MPSAKQASQQNNASMVVVYLQNATALMRQGFTEDALKLLEKLVKQHPANAEAAGEYIRALAKLGRTQEAEDAYTNFIALQPDALEVQLARTDMLLAAGKAEEAYHEVQRLLSLNPEHLPTLQQLVKLQIALGYREMAIRSGRKLINKLPNDAQVRFLLGEAYASNGEIEEAILAYHDGLRYEPNNEAALARYAWLMEQSDDRLAAQEAYRRILTINPNNREAIYRYGLQLADVGKIDEARQLLGQLQMAAEGSTEHRHLFARLLVCDQRFEEADRAYEALLKQFPNDPELLKEKAKILFHRGEADRALQLITRAIELKPNYTFYYEQGLVLTHLGQTREAIEAFQHALTQLADYFDAYVALGVAYEKMGRDQEAMKAYQVAVKINPENTNAQYRLFQVLSRLNLTEDALTVLSHIQNAEPSLREEWFNEQVVKPNKTKYDEALENVLMTIEVNPRLAKTMYFKAMFFVSLGDNEQALEHLAKALQFNPVLREEALVDEAFEDLRTSSEFVRVIALA